MRRRFLFIKENKGLTLVELIIAFAILAILSVMTALIVRTTGRTYTGISTDINLQYESQVAMSQLQEYVMDCNAAIAASADGSALYIFNRTNGTQYAAYKIAQADDTLYLFSKTIEAESLDPGDAALFAFGDGQLMSSYVAQFDAVITVSREFVDSVDIVINYAAGTKTFTGTQTIALRNQVTKFSVPAM